MGKEGAHDVQHNSTLEKIISVTDPEEELVNLRELRSALISCHHGGDDDDIEENWLHDTEESGFRLQKTFTELFCDKQEQANELLFYVFDRRYGWTEGGAHVILARKKSASNAHCKAAINTILDELIRWLDENPVNKELLNAYQYSIGKAKDKPVVRKHTVVHLTEWLKIKTDSISEDIFEVLLEVLMMGITDVWSAIRNACVSRLSSLAGNFSFLQLEQFFNTLVQICSSPFSSWQSIEGAIMAMNAVVRRFQWIGIIPDGERHPTCSSSPANLSSVKTPKTEYFLKFGEQELRGMPSFISNQMKDVIFPLLAHEQLSIREQAIKTFSSYLSRTEFQEALSAFKHVMKQLSRDIPPLSPGIGLLPRQLMLEAGFKFLDAYEAEGLLGICVFLVKHIPPGFLLPNWPRYFTAFSVYLMHPASTVRQATSSIFKFLVAKDSHNPTMLKLVLQALCNQWQVDISELTSHKALQSQDNVITKGVIRNRGKVQRISITSAISYEYRDEVDLCDTWQWREGRLLAYELICQFLIKNHWLYTFGPPHLWIGLTQDHDSSTEHLYSPSTASNKQQEKQKEDSPSSSFGGNELRSTGGLLRTSSEKRPRNKTSPRQRVPSGDLNTGEVSECGSSAFSRKHSLKSLVIPEIVITTPTPADMMSSIRMRRGRSSISTCSPTTELPPPFSYNRMVAENESNTTSPDSATSKLIARLPTVAGFSSPSLRTLVKHYSYYTKPESKTPFTAPTTSHVPKAASLLMHTLALDQQQETDRETPSPRYEAKSEGRRRSILCPSPINLESGELDVNQEEDWFVDTELSSMAELLQTVLHQTSQSMADASWELRRMGQQLLPCVVEVIRWYDMKILEDLWSSHLVPGTNLLCYGACQALKFSIVHAAKLQPMLQQPPPSWQDAEMCREVVLRITDTIRNNLPRYLGVVNSILCRPVVDKLTVLAAEILMLAHTHFCLPIEQKLVHIKGIVNLLSEVFYKAHPNTTVATSAQSNKIMDKVFQSPSEGFFSCCTKPTSPREAASQVENYILTEAHTSLLPLLQATASVGVNEKSALLPILCSHIVLYADNDEIQKSLIDSVCILTGQCCSFMENDESAQSVVGGHCKVALQEIACIITQQDLELSVVKQMLDVNLQLTKALQKPNIHQLLQAICNRLNNVKDLHDRRFFVAGVCNGDDDMCMLKNYTHDMNGNTLGSSDDDDELDPPTCGLMQESQTLTLSGATSKRSTRLSVNSSQDGRSGTPTQAGSDGEDSDWDSWDEDDVCDQPDQSAVVLAFSDFIKKLDHFYKTTTKGAKKKDTLELEMAKFSSKDYNLLKNLLR